MHEFAGLLKTFEKLATIAGKFSYPQESRRAFFYGNFVIFISIIYFLAIAGKTTYPQESRRAFFYGKFVIFISNIHF